MPGSEIRLYITVLSADLITEILTADMVALPNEFTGMYWSALANIFACNDEDEAVMSGQGLGSQAINGTISPGIVYGSSTSRAALRDVHVNVAVLFKQYVCMYTHPRIFLWPCMTIPNVDAAALCRDRDL